MDGSFTLASVISVLIMSEEPSARPDGQLFKFFTSEIRSSMNKESVPDGGWPLLARTSKPRARDPVRIAVLADPHTTATETGTWKLLHRTEEYLQRAVDDLEGDTVENVDLVIHAGDLTRDGRSEEFDRFDEIVGDLTAPSIAVPGNHDVEKSSDDHESPSLAEFKARYGVDEYPHICDVGGVQVVALNSATTPDGSLRDGWGGAVSNTQLQKLRCQLPDLSDPIVVLHHNLFPQPEHPQGSPWDGFVVHNSSEVVDVLAANDVPLVISAHHHLPSAIHSNTTSEDTPLEVVSPAICSFPQAYLVLEIDRTGTAIRYVPLAEHDEHAEAWHAARTGEPVGVGIATMAEKRLQNIPLYDERTET